MAPSSGPDSVTLQTIQSLQNQIAELEAKEDARGELTKSQAAKLDALEAELTALKASKVSASHGNASDTEPETSPSESTGRLAHWCPW
jgi:hypothetical protein